MAVERIPARPWAGAATIALALLFNVPYAILAATYDYPGVLRRPAGEALTLFAEGGSALILTWYGFVLAALALAPLAVTLSITPSRIVRSPGVAIGAAIVGGLAGVTQAIGLSRWVFVVPGLARTHADPRAGSESAVAAERAFDILNQYGGVAIGEHLGQLLTALFVLLISRLQWSEARRFTAGVGLATGLSIAVGTNEGLAIALGQSGEIFSLATIVGFLGLTVWLVMTGLGLMRPRPAHLGAASPIGNLPGADDAPTSPAAPPTTPGSI